MIRKSKYEAKKTVIDGIKFASKKEGTHYLKLKFLNEKGYISNLKLQVPFKWIEFCSINPDDTLEPFIEFKRKYVADFTFYDSDGKFNIVDVKGFKTAEYKKKKKIVEKLYKIIIKEI